MTLPPQPLYCTIQGRSDVTPAAPRAPGETTLLSFETGFFLSELLFAKPGFWFDFPFKKETKFSRKNSVSRR
ncbi:protein of unknown function [Candidatus Promineifilum breve]|uniref:Uncharacterized protein n=1 Tax=Candidatus Promineifilum breve TaxID=1806508 RepID=A0A160T8B5_9CHLR|nr:protein of unknown function [Candidatus Promineifilum breve]